MNIVTGCVVANSILLKSFNEEVYIKPLKLNYLIYLLYSNYLYKTGEKLFTEPFVVTSRCPIVSSVHYKFSCFKNNVINKFSKDSMGNVFCAQGEEYNKHLDEVWNKYKYYNEEELFNLINKENGAYYNAKVNKQNIIYDIDILDEMINKEEKVLKKAKEYRDKV